MGFDILGPLFFLFGIGGHKGIRTLTSHIDSVVHFRYAMQPLGDSTGNRTLLARVKA